MKFDPQPVLLEGNHVRLEPLQPDHAKALFRASRDPALWTFLPIEQFGDLGAVAAWIDEARRAQAAGMEVPYATVRKSDRCVVGSTRFLDIRRPHRGLEIGWTWIMSEAQRTVVNTEAKYLMLAQAFDVWGALRVQLKTDARNQRSRDAIQRLGGRFEGILRKQMLRAHDGFQRDSALFSILDLEWPDAKTALEVMLARAQ